MAKSKQPKTPTRELPPDVKVADLSYPGYKTGDSLGYEALRELGLDHGPELTFYRIKERNGHMRWILTTLGISKSRRADRANRTYGIQVDNGGVVRVGLGPHVVDQVVVYLSKVNLERLAAYPPMYLKGLEAAGQIRDRISSRRAQGQLNRAAGLHSWMWDK